uniref:Ribosomal protein S15 n=1 Tax=Dipsacus japonicus TaxID=398306 RepID=A0A385JQ16_9DIPS|nr:ribosomal protein S15 [Dipsacus japonicus]AXZ62491.1 ribosomal protein S15 [Dipsacus japonicus]
MIKKAFVSIILQKETKENRGSAEFQIVNFTNKIRKLTSHLELHKKTICLRETCEKFWENVNGC